MAQISRELILELQRIIKDEYGREISFEESAKIAEDLVGYFELLAKIEARIKNKNNE